MKRKSIDPIIRGILIFCLSLAISFRFDYHKVSFWLALAFFYMIAKIYDIHKSITRTEKITQKTLESINKHLERLDKIATAVYTEEEEEEEEDNSPTRISIN